MEILRLTAGDAAKVRAATYLFELPPDDAAVQAFLADPRNYLLIAYLEGQPAGFVRAHELQQECLYLVKVHAVEWVIAIFHGPAEDGPAEAMCADYRRKFEWASVADLRAQQEQDARELLDYRWQWAGRSSVDLYRCEVGANGDLAFVTLST